MCHCPVWTVSGVKEKFEGLSLFTFRPPIVEFRE